MPHELERAFKYGIAIDASAIAGFGDEVNSDLFLHPDASTIALLPWRPEHGSVVRMFCSITHPDGTPFAHDTRGILKQAVADAAKAGYAFSFGSELEFYLFRLDENGEVTDVPYDQATYMDVAPEDRCENVRREICLTLERMGIQPESSHHEEGPGQNEVDFRYSDPLSAADNAVTFLTVVKTIAARNGLYADFSPRPLEGRPGSGFHINMSVQGGAEALMHRAMGGILDKITDMTLFLNPTVLAHTKRRSTFRGRATTAPSSFAFLPPPASTGASSCAAPTAPPTHILPLRCSSGRDFPESRTTLLSRKPATSISTRRIPEM